MTDMTVHDILNKISVINGYRALLAGQPPEHPKFQQGYEKMMEAVDGIRQYTEFTRFYLGGGVQPSTWLDLDHLVRETVKGISHENVNIVIDAGSV